MNFWKLTFCLAAVAIMHLSKINADDHEHEASAETNKVEEVVDAANVYADSYANYYAQFPELYQTIPQQYYQAAGVRPKRKQGVADLMTEMLGTDAAITLGTIGSTIGLLSLLGLAVNAIAINDLSQDQDSICSATEGVGNTALTATTLTDLGDATAATNAQIQARLNLIETAINNFATPDC